jgi:hypothetical protein
VIIEQPIQKTYSEKPAAPIMRRRRSQTIKPKSSSKEMSMQKTSSRERFKPIKESKGSSDLSRQSSFMSTAKSSILSENSSMLRFDSSGNPVPVDGADNQAALAQGTQKPFRGRRNIRGKTTDPTILSETIIQNGIVSEEEETPAASVDEKKPQKIVKKRVKRVVVRPKPPSVNKKEAQKKEEEELLAKLMANTTDLEVNGIIDAFSSKSQLKSLRKMLKKEKSEVKPLNTKISLDLDNFTSLKAFKQLENEKKKEDHKKGLDFQRLNISRYASTTKLIERVPKERPMLKMMSNYEIESAPRVFMCFDAPTLWDKRAGKLRRNSV